MKPISSTTPLRVSAFAMWLITLVIGGIAVALTSLLSNSSYPYRTIGLAVIVSGFAACFSSPTLLILPVIICWALTPAAVEQRWCRLLLIIMGLFSCVALGGCWFLLDGRLVKVSGLLCYTIPYLGAAIIAAACVYRPWLFRS